MRKSHPAERKPLIRVVAWAAVLLLLAGWGAVRGLDHKGFDSVDFSTLGDDRTIINTGLIIGQRYRLKIDYLRHAETQDVVLFGNHVMRHYGKRRLFSNLRFFNLAETAASIPETIHQMRALEDAGKLPRKAMIVSILAYATPELLTDYRISLPVNHYARIIFRDGLGANIFNALFDVAERYTKAFFNYETVLIGFLGYEGRLRTVAIQDCLDAAKAGPAEDAAMEIRNGLAGYLPPAVVLGTGLLDTRSFCNHRRLSEKAVGLSYRSDGSILYSKRTAFRKAHPITAPPGSDTASFVRRSARNLQTVADIGARHGIKTVFLVPPRYVERMGPQDDEVLNAALRQVSGAIIIDDRDLNEDRRYYYDGGHLTPAYFDHLDRRLAAILGLGSE